ncbi:MAG: extracellular solute-binding protein [Planctomycetes bacterium]|nr:extracellular solute-binding protein [Planctomycetota bacterium]
MKQKVLLIMCLFFAMTCFFVGGQENAAAASPGGTTHEGSVAFYANITAIEPLLEDLHRKSGIKGAYTRISTTQFLATVFTEFEAGKLLADVIQAPIPVMEQLAAREVLAPYVSPSAAGYPEWAKREKDGIYMFGIEYVSIIYNHELVRPADVPKRYQDLADPKWKDKIVMPNPSIHPTTISWLVALREHVFNHNDDQWRAFLRGLAANNPMFVASFGPTPAPIASGEKPIGISMPKYIITNAPAPLDWARIEPVMGSPRAIGISAKAPRPVAARQFVDYWLTADAGKILADQVGEYVLVPGVFPPIDGMDKARVIPIEELADAAIAQWGAEFKTIFDVR